MIKKISSPVKIILKTKEGIKGISKLVTAPIPWISAPIFNVIAGKLNTAIRYKILFGYFFLSVAVIPHVLLYRFARTSPVLQPLKEK